MCPAGVSSGTHQCKDDATAFMGSFSQAFGFKLFPGPGSPSPYVTKQEATYIPLSACAHRMEWKVPRLVLTKFVTSSLTGFVSRLSQSLYVASLAGNGLLRNAVICLAKRACEMGAGGVARLLSKGQQTLVAQARCVA